MYKLSNLAVDNFTAIYEYTLLNFGVAQADQYTQHLENTFHLLVSSPLIGYACVDIGEGIRRHDHHQHAIFYKKQDYGIFIIRILHQQMQPMKHFFAL
ncbi:MULTISPECIES: type II toxin-antitoxin system RelE/ParE family toxin [unclassified Acinetobacter]|uniref:type II toxin-antitoxin system RelE/ParE family toxin n=1 Tax=unclassified Acinetobacter TaxID=196816 RepID=UPI0015D24B3C